MPGVLASMPPKTAARGREQDRLFIYLLLTGNSTFTLTEYRKLAEDTVNVFYQTQRAVTSALRASTDYVNKTLLERNMKTSASGQYALAWLALAAVRESQCIFSLSGPMHAYWFGQSESRHYFEPVIAGKGLGSSQTLNIHYMQTSLQSGDLMLFCGRVPNAWTTPLEDAKPSSFEAMRRRLTALTTEDLNAVLVQSIDGIGTVNLLKGNAAPVKEEPPAQEVTPPPPPTEEATLVEQAEPTPTAHVLQPSAYSIPPRQEEAHLPSQTQSDPLASLPHKTTPREFPASIPRAKPKVESIPEPEIPASVFPADKDVVEESRVQDTPAQQTQVEESKSPPQPAEPREPSQRTRQAAKAIVTGMQTFRQVSATLAARLRNFLPRLLPESEASDSTRSSDFSMVVIAIFVPLIVVVMLFVVYTKYGRNPQYDSYLQQAREASEQAKALTNPIEQRETWNLVLELVFNAESIYRTTSDTISLRQEAEANLDKLLGITRMQFNPAFSSKLGIDVSRMAASEKDLYLLNAANGEVMRAFPSGSGGFELDTSFNCKQGVYGNYTVGPLVDIMALPVVNFIDATLLGIDANGNLLYCAPGQIPQAIPLPPPDTNWVHITAFTMDSGNLYVLDAPARAVWVYNGKDGTYVDRPYFFFGQQTPTQDVIDFVVSGDEMYMLHGDGRLSNCNYSRIDTSTSQCQDPLTLVNPFPAYQDSDLFGTAHFLQMIFAAPPDPSILLLDADSQSVMRFAPRTLELQNQFRPTTGSTNPIPQVPVSAVAVSPDHVLYLAVNQQVYFAVNMP